LVIGSDFVFFALDLAQELNLPEIADRLKELLTSSNQTLILKAVEVLKSINKLGEVDKNAVLERISDGTIKAIIESNF